MCTGYVYTWMYVHVYECTHTHTHTHTHEVYTTIKVNVETVVDGDLKASFSIVIILRCRERCYSSTELLQFTLDTYLIRLCVK